MRRKSLITKNEKSCTQELQNSVRAATRRVKALSADISLGFLRGYQSGYEDCTIGLPPQHYARPREEIKKDI